MTKTVAVIGGDDALTDLLVRTLRAHPAVERCALLTEDGSRLEDRLAAERIDTAVVLGARGADGLPSPPAADEVFRAVARADVQHLVLVSSAAVCPPHHHHLGMVTEDRLPSSTQGSGIAGRWRGLEERAQRAAGSGEMAVTVLRPAAVPLPDSRTFPACLLRRRIAATVVGFDPTVQLLAASDLAGAVAHAVDQRPRGTFHLVPRHGIPLRKALKRARTLRLPLPHWLHRLYHLLTKAPYRRAEADALRHSFTIATSRGDDLGFVPRLSSAQAIDEARGDRAQGTESAEPEGDDEHDPFGFDRQYVDRLGRTFFRLLHDAYWRIEYEGVENVPREGRGVLTGVHRGFMPWDGVMALHLLARERGRYPRFLIHPCLVKFPFLAPYMIRLGGILACRENADWVLDRNEIVGIFPEGIRGAFTPYRKAYELGRFGRDDYVRIALLNQAPILPFVTVGSAEIFPILGGFRWKWARRLTEWPYLPVTASLPGIPNPSKWHTRFLEPLHVERAFGPEAAEDPETVRAISMEVREAMTKALADMLERRKHVFFGSIFDPPRKGSGQEEAG